MNGNITNLLSKLPSHYNQMKKLEALYPLEIICFCDYCEANQLRYKCIKCALDRKDPSEAVECANSVNDAMMELAEIDEDLHAMYPYIYKPSPLLDLHTEVAQLVDKLRNNFSCKRATLVFLMQ